MTLVTKLDFSRELTLPSTNKAPVRGYLEDHVPYGSPVRCHVSGSEGKQMEMSCPYPFGSALTGAERFGGYVMDRRQGNTGGLGGLLGPFYAIGKPLPFPEAQPYAARPCVTVQVPTSRVRGLGPKSPFGCSDDFRG